MTVELLVDDPPPVVRHWEDGPITAEHAIRGFHSATLWVNSVRETAELLTGHLGYTFVGQEGNRHRFKGAGKNAGLIIDLLERPGLPPARLGAGSVHHIAFRTVDDEEQLEYQQSLRGAGYYVTPVMDRQYFHSIYFRSPGGVLFEIATDAPGFTLDEPVSELGSSLKLPPWLEPRRQEIEQALPQFAV